MNKFLVYSSLIIFTLLLALRLDGSIEWNYWSVFLPLWIWKIIVFLGAITGSYVWWKHPECRIEGDGYVQFKAMLISFALHILLALFELLACDKLETNRHLWISVFIPMILLGIICIGVCIWAAHHDRSFEIELFCSVNILQYVFFAVKLDHFSPWKWVIIFVPLWIVMCVALVGIMYAIIFAIMLLRTPEVSHEQKQASVYSAFAYCLLVIPLLVFLVIFTDKLDGRSSASYLTTCIPLFISFFTLLALSFGSKGANQWWFGIRKDFCQFILSICPLLREYGNISYSLHDNEEDISVDAESSADLESPNIRSEGNEPKVMFPSSTLEMPD